MVCAQVRNTSFRAKACRVLVLAAASTILTFMLVFTSGCASSGQESVANGKSAVNVISPEEAHEMMSSRQVVVLDVRTQKEYGEGHVRDAVLLPLDAITEETALAAIPSKDCVVLVYCRSGRRSAEAAARLSEMGYEQVYDFGGIQSWPYEVYTE